MNHDYTAIGDAQVEKFYREVERNDVTRPPMPGLVWAFGMWLTPETRDDIAADLSGMQPS